MYKEEKVKKNVLLCLSASLIFSCNLFTSYDKFIGETPYSLNNEQREKMNSVFGEGFVNGANIYQANFDTNKDNPIIGGRDLLAVYCPELDKIWVNTGVKYNSGNVLYHEMTHSWQNRVLGLPMSKSQSGNARLDIEHIKRGFETNYHLGNEIEANLVEKYLSGYVELKEVEIYKKYMKNVMLLKIE